MIKRSIGLLILLITAVLGVQAQSTSSLRINEVLTNNVSNYTDAYGNRGAWIEIYNASAGSVQLAGCYLTTDKENPKMYMISKGDVKTKIAPRQRVLIWADGEAHRGTFHTNFKLNSNQENYIALYEANGKTLIQEVTVPALAADQSYGATHDGAQELEILASPTPEAANFVEQSNLKEERFATSDPIGIGMAVTAMAVVFLALMVLYLVFKCIGKISVRLSAMRQLKGGHVDSIEAAKANAAIPGAVLAAISMAIYEHQEAEHDYEETVLTMKRVKRVYSPWSSRIYGMRQMPNRKK